jgi:hypothetical protein
VKHGRHKRVDELYVDGKWLLIERHVKNRDAFTDIYNCAYEAKLISIDEKRTHKIDKKTHSPN